MEVLIMLTEYIDEALKRARYELIEDEEPYYGEVEDLKGVWATGKTLEECRNNLKDVVEGWILISIKKGLPIPKLGGKRIKEIQESSSVA
jgi:predicted RNase H-like HicB family nuclease